MSIRPGPRNRITDVAGILVGNAEDCRIRTGTTVIYPVVRCAAAADIRGGGPGTLNIHALDPTSLSNEVDAIVLSGGSMYGHDAAGAVVAALGARGRGISFGGAVVPVVPGAILFDLANGGDKAWGEIPPYAALGRAALASVGEEFALGNAGAGYGARAGALKGGLGSASCVTPDGLTIGALVAVNSFGSVVMPGTNRFWAGPWEMEAEFGDLGPPPPGWQGEAEMPLPPGSALNPMANTTLAVVAVDAALSKAEAQRLAIMAQDGLARAIRPIHTPFDGDSIFVLATGKVPLTGPAMLARLGHLAADTLARAVARGVYEAESLGDRPGWREAFGR
ncbi:P1 family peptidase [Siccirubricoccus sp. KC 17139]|uniref:P1 family peptidase n=1 Tax=Siccirubricoccus soli TaxID=2899147 RepID=A0ABT1D3E9_9PROT|nr:P1 family peptidase [Siccirubricoccus soli]MCO6416450.1 P1 family peptidase [Siccirubricoccus soli]MCP2682584.1 P1 family peptidase [Siccirubricoccus soli]